MNIIRNLICSPNAPRAQVCLDHAEACNAEEAANARQDLVPTTTIKSECEDDIRDWTTTGLRQFDMYRLVSDRIKPLQLGDPGRQKVSETPAV